MVAGNYMDGVPAGFVTTFTITKGENDYVMALLASGSKRVILIRNF